MVGVIVAAIFVIIFTAYAYNTGKHKTEMSHLSGFWETNKTFNEESGLSVFTMYIGKYSNGVYPVYLLMVDTDENILINTPSNMSLSRSSLLNFKLPFKLQSSSAPSSVFKEFKATFTDLGSEFIPNNVTIKYFPQSCKFVLVGDDTIYGCLFKNPELTEMVSIKDEDKKQSSSNAPSQDVQDNTDVFHEVA